MLEGEGWRSHVLHAAVVGVLTTGSREDTTGESVVMFYMP